MKKRLQGLIAGMLIGAMLTSGVVFAKQASETINVVYDNIKILIDGKEYQPTDANGNVVEPFIYNGTTYLPVRAIATAFDKEVDWEAQTSTVTLGSKNYDWLDQMGYVDYDFSTRYNTVSIVSNDTKMSDGNKYDRGLLFNLSDRSIGQESGTIELEDGAYVCYESLSYLLNQGYINFEGVLSVLDDYNYRTALLKVYGDNDLLYTSPIIADGMKSTSFKINVEDVKILKLYVEVINPSGYGNITSENISFAIADARLSKK